MENRITTGTLVAVGLSAVLAYAAPQQPHQPQPPRQQPAQPAGAPPGASDRGRDGATTITGCPQQGSTKESYVLVQSPATSVSQGGIGTAGARPVQGNRYHLIGSPTDLSKMIGKQVQATGTVTLTPARAQTPEEGDRGRSAPLVGGNDKDLQGRRTGDAVRDGDRKAGLGHESQRGSAGDASLSRFNVKSIKQTGASC